jgi:GMP synthase (glutamine-hydrolysing)
VREAHVYSEIVPHAMPVAEMLARKPRGIILSGGPKSVHVEGAPTIDPSVYGAGVPVLGICYGAQLVASQLGGEVARTGKGEYGRTSLDVIGGSALLGDLPVTQNVWMSHGDSIVTAPPGFRVTARTADVPVAGLEDPEMAVYGVQFHPEVAHTERGQEILKHFLYDVCGCRPTWTMASSSRSRPSGPRSATSRSSAGCRAASTRQWPLRWCTRRWATSSRVCSSTPG